MTGYVRDGSSWKQIEGLWIRDESSWKEVLRSWIADGSAWKRWYTAIITTPNNLTATKDGTNNTSQVNVSWDAVADADSYVVERSETGAFGGSQTEAYSGTGTSFNDTGLEDGKTYTYRAKAIREGISSNWTQVADYASATTDLETPTLSSVTSVGYDNATLNVTDNSQNEAEIRVYLSTVGSSSGFEEYTPPGDPDATTIDLVGLDDDEQYWVKVVNWNSAAGESPDSAVLTFTTLLGPPGDIADVDVTPDCTSLDISWSPDVPRESGYNIYVKPSDDIAYPTSPTATASADTTGPVTVTTAGENDDAITENTNYDVKVEAYNDNYVGGSAEELGVTTLTTPAKAVAPTPAQPENNLVNVDLALTSGEGDTWDIERAREGTLPVSFNRVETGYTGPSPYPDDSWPDSFDTNWSLDDPSSFSASAYSSTFQDDAEIDLSLSDSQYDEIVLEYSFDETNWVEFNRVTTGGTKGPYQFPIDNTVYFRCYYVGENPNGDWKYRVRATSVCGDGSWSDDSSLISVVEQSVYSTTDSLTFTSIGNPRNFDETVAGLTLTDQSDAFGCQVLVEWNETPGRNYHSFELERRNVTQSGAWEQIATPDYLDTSFTDDTLTVCDGTDQWEYRLRIVNDTGSSAWVSETITPDSSVSPPAAPSSVTATDQSGGGVCQVLVEWTDNATEESGFEVERQIGTGSWTQVGTPGQNAESFTDTSLSTCDGATDVKYRVRSVNTAGESAWVESNTIQPDDSGLAAPTNVSVGVLSSTSIRVFYDSVVGATGYDIQRSNDGGSSWTTIANDTTTEPYDDTGLTDGVEYTYRVRATDGAQDSAWSATDSGVTFLEEPTLSSATATGADTASVDYTDGGSASEEEIRVYVSNNGEFGTYTLAETFDPNTTSGTITDLAANTLYWVEIRNWNAAYGERPMSSSRLSFQTDEGATPPGTPSLSVTMLCDSADLSWNDVAGEDDYLVEYRVFDVVTWTTWAVRAAGSTGALITGLSQNETYDFRVTARNAQGNTESNVVQDTTGTVPGTPAAPNASVAGENSVNVTLPGGGNSFNIRRRRQGFGEVTELIASGETGTNYNDPNFPAPDSAWAMTDPPPAPTENAHDSDSITLDFPTDLDADTYEIDRKVGTGSWVVGYDSIPASGGLWTDSALTPSETYQYRYRAKGENDEGQYDYQIQEVNECGGSSYSGFGTDVNPTQVTSDSGTISITTDGLTAPVAPSNVVAFDESFGGVCQVRVSWTDEASNEDSYEVQRNINSAGWVTKATGLAADTEEWTDTTLSSCNGTDTVQYRVRAVNTAGNSAWVESNTVSPDDGGI